MCRAPLGSTTYHNNIRFKFCDGNSSVNCRWVFGKMLWNVRHNYPDNKVHEANMGPTWVLSAPDGPHAGPMNIAIRVYAFSPVVPSDGTKFPMNTSREMVNAFLHICCTETEFSFVSIGICIHKTLLVSQLWMILPYERWLIFKVCCWKLFYTFYILQQG